MLSSLLRLYLCKYCLDKKQIIKPKGPFGLQQSVYGYDCVKRDWPSPWSMWANDTLVTTNFPLALGVAGFLRLKSLKKVWKFYPLSHRVIRLLRHTYGSYCLFQNVKFMGRLYIIDWGDRRNCVKYTQALILISIIGTCIMTRVVL